MGEHTKYKNGGGLTKMNSSLFLKVKALIKNGEKTRHIMEQCGVGKGIVQKCCQSACFGEYVGKVVDEYEKRKAREALGVVVKNAKYNRRIPQKASVENRIEGAGIFILLWLAFLAGVVVIAVVILFVRGGE